MIKEVFINFVEEVKNKFPVELAKINPHLPVPNKFYIGDRLAELILEEESPVCCFYIEKMDIISYETHSMMANLNIIASVIVADIFEELLNIQVAEYAEILINSIFKIKFIYARQKEIKDISFIKCIRKGDRIFKEVNIACLITIIMPKEG